MKSRAHAEITLLMDALAFSAYKHRNQRRKDVDASPYINHPIALARVLAVEGGVSDHKTLAAAIQHGIGVLDVGVHREVVAPRQRPETPPQQGVGDDAHAAEVEHDARVAEPRHVHAAGRRGFVVGSRRHGHQRRQGTMARS